MATYTAVSDTPVSTLTISGVTDYQSGDLLLLAVATDGGGIDGVIWNPDSGVNGDFLDPMSGGSVSPSFGTLAVKACINGGTGSGQVEISLDTGLANTAVAVLIHLRHATLSLGLGTGDTNTGTSDNPLTSPASWDEYLAGFVLTEENGNGPDGTWNEGFTAGVTRGNGAGAALRISEGYRVLTGSTSTNIDKDISVSQEWGALAIGVFTF